MKPKWGNKRVFKVKGSTNDEAKASRPCQGCSEFRVVTAKAAKELGRRVGVGEVRFQAQEVDKVRLRIMGLIPERMGASDML